ncbi:3-methyladenine DNA glycosylase [Nocardioides antri]|uniref:3-methyladenine DNA glycosylase n=1 Tax=Nocardioides antri TaxID=2607659 RepID=UPI0027B9A3F6|nr:3-methyladenine DNA glycosylase [Nocardioides antri]
MEVRDVQVLSETVWRERAAAHAARVDRYLAPHLQRRSAGLKHPVFDFLFTYYSFRPSQLRRWTPGFGQDPAVTAEYVAERAPLIRSLHRLLTATAGRTGHFGCFGLHEWAMVYRLTEDETRHADWPLRLGPAGTDAVVEQHRIACSHFDAYRFFTEPARPLNTLSPGRDDRPSYEQPACLHAGMDLYKHAFRLSPMVPSDLVADCFELAWDIRVMDMRAAPYDLAELGFDPVRIETPEGKAEYVAAQRAFAERGAPLRKRLIEECERLLTDRTARLRPQSDPRDAMTPYPPKA